MFKLSVCIDTVMRKYSFEEAARIIADQNFAVDFWWHMEHDVEKVFRDPKIRCGAFTGYYGGCRSDPSSGGSTLHPDYVDKFLESIEQSLILAKKVNCKNLVLSSGQLGPDGEIRHPIHSHPITRWITAYKSLCRIAELAEKYEVTYSMEHLNTKPDPVSGEDHAGYVYPHVEDVVRMLDEVGSPRLKLLLDYYQAQVQEGNLVDLTRKYHKYIGYIHVADVPNRLVPGRGEINYKLIVQTLKDVGYEGPVGLECYGGDDPLRAMAEFRELFS